MKLGSGTGRGLWKGYQTCRGYDDRFLVDVEMLVARSDLAGLKEEIERVGWQTEKRRLLTTPTPITTMNPHATKVTHHRR